MSSSSNNVSTVVEVLYREHHGWLTAWLKKKTACPHHAADLSHDTFIRLLSQPDLPVLKEPRAYLLVTANRLMINLNRKRRVEEETLHSMAVLISGQSSQDAAHVSAIRQLLERVLFMLLEELDERTRKAFLMSRVDGMTYTEIAYVMNVSENRIKQYLVKALAYCHQRLYQFKAELHG
ncbi:sigma-70 family RNA polymerase sigma factor [Nitrosomonas sp.]|uniref:sigma-70 family RNA polymerase sigma factor n=1 Tax=Nitrosomonas sp. TaxID=42353 RepID=UPI001DE111B2|nr:sigma-70 family RNA polymerase sigma factor [Nitrosomonas sp.]MCB1950123.1 sigma-70 family RNA polymerase sigma factor [Nitrosomonas sp.]